MTDMSIKQHNTVITAHQL